MFNTWLLRLMMDRYSNAYDISVYDHNN